MCCVIARQKWGENGLEEGRVFGPPLLGKHRLEPQTDLLSIVTLFEVIAGYVQMNILSLVLDM